MIEQGTKNAFPEGAIRLPDIQTVGMTSVEMEQLADATRGLNLGEWGRRVLRRAPAVSGVPQTRRLVAMNAHTMGIRQDNPTTNEVWKKAKEFGDKVSAEEMLKIAIEVVKGNGILVEIGKPLVGIMEPVVDSDDNPRVLVVVRRGDGLWLSARYAYPGRQWGPGFRFVVSSRE